MEYKTTNRLSEERINEILRIKDTLGLTPENLIKEAKKKSNPLHNLFEWDDTEAARKWRLQQGRLIINEIKIIVDTEERYAFENVKMTISTEEENVEEESPKREYKSMM